MERWVAWVCSPEVLWAWMGLALAVFCLLFWVTAPYGRHSRAGWGPTVPAPVGWFLMEIVTLVGMGTCFVLGSNRQNGALVLGCLYGGHYLYRSLYYPWTASPSAAPVSASIVASSVGFNVVNSTILGGWIFMLSTAEPALFSVRGCVGVLLFFVGFFIHIRSDSILRNLRRDHGPGYHIPIRFLYRWVSCPNYFGELLQWVGFAILVDALAGWTFAVWTAANLVPRAVIHHRWYQQRFDDYPKDRRAIFPGIL